MQNILRNTIVKIERNRVICSKDMIFEKFVLHPLKLANVLAQKLIHQYEKMKFLYKTIYTPSQWKVGQLYDIII